MSSGCRVRTMPASPPRTWWSANWLPKAGAGMSWAAKIYRGGLEWRKQYGNAIINQLKTAGGLLRLAAGALHHGRGAFRGGAQGVCQRSTKRGSFTAGSTSSTGAPAATRPWRSGGGTRRAGRPSLPYPLPLAENGGQEGVVVATTRPETMLGDTAVAVNPEDERYRTCPANAGILPLMESGNPHHSGQLCGYSFGTGGPEGHAGP
jgi:valyl-tRNA synthetase